MGKLAKIANTRFSTAHTVVAVVPLKTLLTVLVLQALPAPACDGPGSQIASDLVAQLGGLCKSIGKAFFNINFVSPQNRPRTAQGLQRVAYTGN